MEAPETVSVSERLVNQEGIPLNKIVVVAPGELSSMVKLPDKLLLGLLLE